MTHVYHATVPRDFAPTRMDTYLASAMPLLPYHVLREAFAKRDVKCGGKRVGPTETARPGETVSVYTPFAIGLPVVYEDENLLVVNKPYGISSEDDGRGGMTVASLMSDLYGGENAPRLAHRLDNPTCGLLLLSKNPESEAILYRAFEERTVDKYYQCLVRGQMRPEKDSCSAYLVKMPDSALVRVVSHKTPGAVPIETAYETLSFDGSLSRLRVKLVTGRTHQIRAHLSALSHPILGDDKYGDRAFNKRYKTTRLHLCACETVLHTDGILSYLDGKRFTVEPDF